MFESFYLKLIYMFKPLLTNVDKLIPTSEGEEGRDYRRYLEKFSTNLARLTNLEAPHNIERLKNFFSCILDMDAESNPGERIV